MKKCQGTAKDIEIQAEEITRNKEVLCKILGQHAGKSPEQIDEDSHWDFFMSAEEAKDYGLVDQVIESIAPEATK